MNTKATQAVASRAMMVMGTLMGHLVYGLVPGLGAKPNIKYQPS